MGHLQGVEQHSWWCRLSLSLSLRLSVAVAHLGMPVVRERLNYCWAAATAASANGFYYYLHTCCSRGIVLNKNSNFHTCISRCCRVRAPRRRRPRRARRRSLGYGIGCRISWQSGKTDVATSVCLAQHTHTDTEQTQPQHTLVSHALTLSAGLSLSLCCALSGSCCAAYALAGSRAGVECDNDDVGSSWLCDCLGSARLL